MMHRFPPKGWYLGMAHSPSAQDRAGSIRFTFHRPRRLARVTDMSGHLVSLIKHWHPTSQHHQLAITAFRLRADHGRLGIAIASGHGSSNAGRWVDPFSPSVGDNCSMQCGAQFQYKFPHLYRYPTQYIWYTTYNHMCKDWYYLY